MEAIRATNNLWKRLCERSSRGELCGHEDGDARRAVFKEVPGGFQLVGMIVDARTLDELLALELAAAEKSQEFEQLKQEMAQAKQQVAQARQG